MPLRLLVLLLLSAFIACTDATSPTISSAVLNTDLPKRTGGRTASGAAISAERLLRTGSDIDEAVDDGDERGGLSIPVFERVKTLFTSPEKIPQKLGQWLTNEKPAEHVLAHMGLDKAKGVLFSSTNSMNLDRWLKYVDDLSAKNPAKKRASAISILSTHYGDAALYDMIRIAKSADLTPDAPILATRLATRLQKDLLQHWLAAAQKPDDVFHFMRLGQSGYSFQKDSEFALWVKYVDDFNAKPSPPDVPALMSPMLTKNFNAGALFVDVEKAKGVENTKRIAAKVQADLEQFWLNNRKSPDDVLELIGFHKTSALIYTKDMYKKTALELPLFKQWAKYADAYSLKYPDEKMTMIETMTRVFGHGRVAKMLNKAKTQDSTRVLAAKLESAQLEMWSKGDKSVDDVYKLLQFEHPRQVAEFYDQPIRLWVSYMDIVLKKNPDEVTSLLSSLQSRFIDRPLNQLLQQAKKFPSMENAATAIQTEKLRGYLAKNESPENVFKLLALNNAVDNVLADSSLTKWMRYVKDFKTKNPEYQVSWFETFHRYYQWHEIERIVAKGLKNPSTRKIAEKLEARWIQYGLDEKHPPKDVLGSLKALFMEENPLLNPMFESWAKYLKQFNERYPNDKTTMLDALEAKLVDSELLRFFTAVTENPTSTKELKVLATDLKSALVSKIDG